MCTMQLLDFIAIRLLGSQLEKAFKEYPGTDPEFEKRLERHREEMNNAAKPFLLEKPKGRAVVNPPQR